MSTILTKLSSNSNANVNITRLFICKSSTFIEQTTSTNSGRRICSMNKKYQKCFYQVHCSFHILKSVSFLTFSLKQCGTSSSWLCYIYYLSFICGIPFSRCSCLGSSSFCYLLYYFFNDSLAPVQEVRRRMNYTLGSTRLIRWKALFFIFFLRNRFYIAENLEITDGTWRHG